MTGTLINKKVKVGITIGDINGIGPEIILKTLSNASFVKQFTPIVYANKKVLDFYEDLLEKKINFNICESPLKAKDNAVNVISVWQNPVKINFGIPTQSSAQTAVQSLEKATAHLLQNNIDCMVTAPLDKKFLPKAGIQFPGHTEYLAAKCGKKSLMILFHKKLRVALATGHLAISKVSKELSKALIILKVKQFNLTLKQDFGISSPKIAILALNPHAGDNGRFGNEEVSTINPAIVECKSQNINADGAFSADGFWGSGAYKKYDGVLAMYHDQGLIPFKALAGWNGVNFTASLPIIRTSPDHGPAFDIAGKGLANAQSFQQALAEAIQLFKFRTERIQ